VDAIVFTAGIGENDAVVRAESLRGLEHMGVVLDPARNGERSRGPRRISSEASRVQVFVIPTNEELAIGRETVAVVAAKG
jgi:acetate kinase